MILSLTPADRPESFSLCTATKDKFGRHEHVVNRLGNEATSKDPFRLQSVLYCSEVAYHAVYQSYAFLFSAQSHCVTHANLPASPLLVTEHATIRKGRSTSDLFETPSLCFCIQIHRGFRPCTPPWRSNCISSPAISLTFCVNDLYS